MDNDSCLDCDWLGLKGILRLTIIKDIFIAFGCGGWAQYGYCASHSRCFWGAAVCTCHHRRDEKARFGKLGGIANRPNRENEITRLAISPHV